MDKMPNPVPETKMPDPVETNFTDVEQKSIADLIAKADAGDKEAVEILRKMRADVVKSVEPKFEIETPVGLRDEDAQVVVMKVVDPKVEAMKPVVDALCTSILETAEKMMGLDEGNADKTVAVIGKVVDAVPEKLVMGVDQATEPDKTAVTVVSEGKVFNFPIQSGGLPEKTLVEKVLDVIVDMAPAGLKEAVADALGMQPELPAQPIALQVDNVAEVAVIPEAPPRVVVPPTIPIRIQKRVARDGTEVYRVHREGDPFYFWTTVYARASAFATSLFHPGCYYVEVTS